MCPMFRMATMSLLASSLCLALSVGCQQDPTGTTPLVEFCSDAIDNDRDGFTDCEDQDCWLSLACSDTSDDDDSAAEDED